jgi:hypothetical protein
MSSLSAKDRVSLCSFTFADGRRCRTPRIRNHPHFCFDHAQKEARARATESLRKDLAYFLSGDYLSACDLSTALGRLIPAVIRGDVKPRNARTVAYMAQILLQSIQFSHHEYINAFGTDNWRDSIRKSVKGNYNYRFPPAPRSGGLQAGDAPQPQHPSAAQPQPQPSSPQTRPPQPAPPPHHPLPPTGAEFAQQVLAGLTPGSCPATPHVQPAPHNPQLAETPAANCHSERSEESAFSSSPAPCPTSAPQPNNSPQARLSTPQPGPNRDAPWLHHGHTSSLRPDGKPGL